MGVFNTDTATCFKYFEPTLIMLALGANYQWEMEEVTTADGY